MIWSPRPKASLVDIDSTLDKDPALFSGGGLHPNTAGHALMAAVFLAEADAILAVEFGFGSTWQTEPADIVWYDETALVLVSPGLSTKRGASSARGQVDTGTCGLSLLNTDRRFDPLYADGPYFGLLLPGVPIRVTVAPPGEAGATIFRGTVPSWPQRYDVSNRFAHVPIAAYDGFDKLSRAKIPRSLLEKEILADTPLAYWRLDETSGALMNDSSGFGRNGSYINGTTGLAGTAESDEGARYEGLMLAGSQGGSAAGTGAAVYERPCVIEALVAPAAANVSGQTIYAGGSGNLTPKAILSVATFNDTWSFLGIVFDGSANNQANVDANSLPLTGAVRHVAFQAPSAGATKVYLDGVNATDANSAVASSFAYAAGSNVGMGKKASGVATEGFTGFLAHVAIFDTDIGATRIAAHADAALGPLDDQTTDERISWILDELGWPTNLRDFETGRSRLGPATFNPGDGALEYLRLVNASEDGLMFITGDGTLRFLDRYWRYLSTEATVSQYTFTDDGDPTVSGYAEFQLDLDDELLVNTARLTRRGGTEQVSTDQTSVDQYGEAEKQQGDLLLRTDNEVLSLAQWAVVTGSVPLPRCPQIRVPLHRYTAEAQQAILGLDLGYRVSVSRTPQGVGSPIELDLVVDGISHDIGAGEWWLTLFVSPVPEATVSLFLLSSSLMSGTDVMAY